MGSSGVRRDRSSGKSPRAKTQPKEAAGGVRARLLARGLDVLFLLAAHPSGLKLMEIGLKSGLPQATALRILRTLGDRDVVVYDAKSKTYGLGPALIPLSDRARTSNVVIQAAKAQLEDLAGRSGETAALFQRIGTERFCIASVISNHDLGYRIEAGQRRPVYSGSGGVALIGHLPTEELDVLIAEVTAEQRQAILEQCRMLHVKGYALGQDNVVRGVTGVAASIWDHSGAVVASLALIGPSARFDADKKKQYGGWVLQEAESISRRLGFSKPFPYRRGDTASFARKQMA